MCQSQGAKLSCGKGGMGGWQLAHVSELPRSMDGCCLRGQQRGTCFFPLPDKHESLSVLEGPRVAVCGCRRLDLTFQR